MRTKALLTIAFASLLQSCTRQEDPTLFLPDDALAVAIIPSAQALSKDAKDLVSRLPEARGLFDILHSVSGLDLLSPQNSMDDGIDPKRPTVLALYDDAFMAILPISNESLAKRRLTLRLARFGFVKEGDVLRHISSREKQASILVQDGVIALCVGRTKKCALRKAQSIEEVQQASEELIVNKKGILVIVRPAFFLFMSKFIPADIASFLQSPLVEPFTYGRIGISLDRGIVVSALFGQKGARIEPSKPPFTNYEQVALVAHLRLPAFLKLDATEVARKVLGLSLPPDALKDFAFRGFLVAPEGKPFRFSLTLDFKNEDSAFQASTLLAPLASQLGLQATAQGRQVIIKSNNLGEPQNPQTTNPSSLFSFLLNFERVQATFDLPSLDFASGLLSALDLAWLDAFFDGPRLRLDAVVKTR
jgi:hypothetical protein